MAHDRAADRHASPQPALRTTTVVWALVGLLLAIAALTVLVRLIFAPAGNESAVPAPRVTVTAGPEAAAPDLTSDKGSGPITAQRVPEVDPDDSAPTVVVGPGIDLSQHSFDDPSSPWVVVNKARPIDPQSWEPPQLDTVGAAELVPEAAAALEQMIDAAGAADLLLRAGSGYRNYGFQESIYGDYAAEHGADRADRFSARPGFSEHQTGWAVDVFGSTRCRIKECFANEPAGIWVAEHAHEYGFVIRYPEGEEGVTGYRFEPWHIRYVGPELATAMREHGIATLEQAFNLPAAPDYNSR